LRDGWVADFGWFGIGVRAPDLEFDFDVLAFDSNFIADDLSLRGSESV